MMWNTLKSETTLLTYHWFGLEKMRNNLGLSKAYYFAKRNETKRNETKRNETKSGKIELN